MGSERDLHESGIVGMQEPPWDDPEFRKAYGETRDDMYWLAANGAFAGVAEIIRERRRQIEALRFTPEHDDRHENGWLMHEAALRIISCIGQMLAGVAGYPEIEEALRQAGALSAAEMDRLLRMLKAEPEDDPRDVIELRGPSEFTATGEPVAPPKAKADTMPAWWPASPADPQWGGTTGWVLHLVHCRPDRCEIGCNCPHHARAEEHRRSHIHLDDATVEGCPGCFPGEAVYVHDGVTSEVVAGPGIRHQADDGSIHGGVQAECNWCRKETR
jgi:hypothetical protein